MKRWNAFRPAMKKPIALLLLIFLLAGLYTPAAAETSTGTLQGSTPASDTASGPLELNWLLPGETPEDFDRVAAKVNEYLKGKVNIKVNFDFLDWEQYLSGTQLTMATGKPVDIFSTPDWATYSQDVQKGNLLALNTLIDQYAPKTKAALGKTLLKATEINGKIYALPSPGHAYASANGIAFRKDLVNKYNIPLGSIKKLEDVEPVLKTIKSKLPTIKPMISSSIDICYQLTGLEPLEDSFLNLGAVSLQNNNPQITNEYAQPGVMSFLKTLNKFSKLGYLKSTGSVLEDMSSGKVFAVLNPNLTPVSYEEDFNHQWINVYLGKPTITSNSATSSMTAISAASAHPAEAVKLLEFINTDAYVTNLFHFGIEGEHYIKKTDGTLGFPAGVDSSNTTYTPFHSGSLPGNVYLDRLWTHEDPNKYKQLKSFNDSAAPSKTFGFRFSSTATAAEEWACFDVKLKYLPKLLTGEYAPEKYIPLLNADLKKAGLDRILAEKQQQYDAWRGTKSSTGSVSGTITVKLGGAPLTMSPSPLSEAGVVLAPMKPLLDNLDSIYDYNSSTKTLTARRGVTSIKLVSGSKSAYVNGKETKLAVAPKLLNNQLYIPAEFVSKAFGFTYTWNGTTKTADIKAANPLENRGNTVANLASGGYVAEKGDWLYLAMGKDGLYRMKSDGSQKTKISDKPVSNINVTNDYLYYVNTSTASVNETMRLYRIKPDGSGKIKLSSNQVTQVSVIGDWIYYINTTDKSKPYKMSLDGKINRKLSDNSLNYLSASNGWLYYTIKSDRKLYRMRTSGADIRAILDDAGYDKPILDTAGDWIYYIPYNGAPGIYKAKTDGSGSEFITLCMPKGMNVNGDWLYYWDSTGSIYKLNEKEHKKLRVATSTGNSMSLAGDWIYYIEYYLPDLSDMDYEDENTNYASLVETGCYRIKTDGQVKQKFDNKGTLADIYVKKPEQTTFESKPVILAPTAPQTIVKTAKEIAQNRSSVAHIKVYDDSGEVSSTGSGFIISSNGVVVTNYHVIAGASSIECTFENEKTYKVDYVLNYNVKKDIAILQLKDAAGLPVVTLGNSDRVELADDVLAIGNPMDLQNTLSTGIISGIRKIIGMHYLQTTAAISPGSSGGPLFNKYGDVIGITSMYIGNSQNLNFAVPINQVKQMLASSRVIPISLIGDYESMVYEFEKNDSLAAADEFSPDQTLYGTISSQKDSDYYKFNMTGSGTLDLYAIDEESAIGASASSSLSVQLLDGSGKVIAEGNNVTEEGLNLLKVTAQLNAGTYYVLVQQKAGTTAGKSQKEYTVTTVVN